MKLKGIWWYDMADESGIDSSPPPLATLELYKRGKTYGDLQ